WIRREPRGLVKTGGKRLDAVVVHEDTGDAVFNRFADAAAAERDDGPAAGERLHGGDAEILFARDDQRLGAAVRLTDTVVVQCTEELDGRTGDRAQAGLVRAGADNLEGPADLGGGPNR